MKILGINETTHDASVSLISGSSILFAGHSERYSKNKNDWFNNDDVIDEALSYGKPDIIAYYEKPLLKKTRMLLHGGHGGEAPFYKTRKDLEGIRVKKFSHHYSHAAAGYYTSRFTDAVIVVLDAIGEWNTSSIWVGQGESIKPVFKKNYPFSFGLFYSAFTDLVGLKANEEEYIFMGMAAYGNSNKYYKVVRNYFKTIGSQKYNFHKGIYDWPFEISEQDKFDIAAAAQKVFEERLLDFMNFAKKKTGKSNLVYMGGCALNCAANTALWGLFGNVWIMPSPGDSGSSLGAAAAAYGKHLDWAGPYLGTEIPGNYPVEKIIESLLKDKIAPVASGRAEYGPRAFGNRSILADPRNPGIKDKVNLIKQRELFRPFAPVVMEEYSTEWFDLKSTSPYMQYAVKCLMPGRIPAVVHQDGTSRVQTVNQNQHPGLYSVLKKWNEITGVPVLLNTSLNVKGQPLLNDVDDIKQWEKSYGFKIIT